MHGLLQDIGIAVIAATVGGVGAYLLRQPIILGYLIAGALLGPAATGVVSDLENIRVISEIGLVLLLFVVGLEMDLSKLIAAGRHVLIAGVAQIALCVAIALPVFHLCGWRVDGAASAGVYLAIACALSSTAIVVKLLYDKVEADTIAGRITIGVLVVQDLFAILVLGFQPNFATPELKPVLLVLMQVAALLAAGWLLSKYVLQALFARLARAPELVVAASLGWCAAISGVAAAIGLSKEMGALVAGMSIAAFPYAIHVAAKTLPLRDFFLTLFFISLGMQITAPSLAMLWQVPLIVAVIVGTRFASAYPALVMLGSGRRTAFLVSLNLAQLSEFSLVIAMLGARAFHHVDDRVVELLVYAMAASSVLSSYLVGASQPLYRLFDRLLARVGMPTSRFVAEAQRDEVAHPIVVLGFHRAARELIDRIAREEPAALRRVLVVDFNVEALRELASKGVGHVFGDVGSLDTLRHAKVGRAHLVLSLVSDQLLKGTDNLSLVRACRALAPHATIVATADVPTQATALHAAGADEVVQPHALAAEEAARLVAMVARRADEPGVRAAS